MIYVLCLYSATCLSSYVTSQEVPPTPGQPVKEPMLIPVAVGLLDSTGKDMPLSFIYNNGNLQALKNGNQPVFTTVLQVKKVRKL